MQLAGDLSQMNLASLIRLVRNGELTGKIRLARGSDKAFIFFETGQPVHVETAFGTGTEALLDLFLWQDGTFSYIECPVNDVPRSLSSEESLETVLEEGLSFREATHYLEQLGIRASTVFQSNDLSGQDPFLEKMDGKTRLKDIVLSSGLSRSKCVVRLKQLLASGKAIVVEKQEQEDKIQLPDWVVSRLKQDNPDITQSIVQLVIWADRIKCWLYQADVELQQIINTIDSPESSTASESEYKTTAESFQPGTNSPDQNVTGSQSTFSSNKSTSRAIQEKEKSGKNSSAASNSKPASRTPRYEF